MQHIQTQLRCGRLRQFDVHAVRWIKRPAKESHPQVDPPVKGVVMKGKRSNPITAGQKVSEQRLFWRAHWVLLLVRP